MIAQEPPLENRHAIRVLFLTRYPVEGASSRYRVFQYIPDLQKLGVHCDVQSFMSSEMYQISFLPGKTHRKIWETVKAVCRRISVVAKHSTYDIVYMQRELLPFGPPWLERWMQWRDAVLFFDYDDALFIKKSSRYNPLATLLRAPNKVLDIFKLVHCVVAGNDWLRDEALRLGASNAVTIEVAEDTDRIQMHASHSNAKPVTIGWLGSTSTVKYLNFIEPVLQKIAKQYPDVQFEIMGGGSFVMKDVPWKITDWSLTAELEALQRFDIGLMPLPMEDWAKGKSGGKARTYMAAGVAPVCAAIGYNLELIEHNKTGFLCADNQQWFLAIESLIQSAELRQQIAENARHYVQEKFAPNIQAMKMKKLFINSLENTEH